ncbi:hypothetical protein BW730_09680 [Tessaracoccus aquimaris]|uniref:Sortase n=1 Tax=Tessaracoccus aquimaris TaxID=1332264 RepID=A0A1Q2CNP7_9ACTN|nr:hypothetical protein [Tessaracoccus aquimaris]AQP47719.1 hypothetical protein BW730_09680 [Tessaracoccus aquimaris]
MTIRRGGRSGIGVGWTLVSVAAATVAVLLGWRWLTWTPSVAPDAPVDLAGRQVPVDLPSDEDVSALDTGGFFEAPVQGLRVPLRSALTAGGVINPPSLTEAYLYRDFGDPGDPASGTVVAAMHSVRGGHGPGNALADREGSAEAPSVRISPGDPLLLGAARYVVTQVEIQAKAATSDDARIWSEGSSDLVVLTCLIDPRVPLADQPNLIVFADRV